MQPGGHQSRGPEKIARFLDRSPEEHQKVQEPKSHFKQKKPILACYWVLETESQLQAAMCFSVWFIDILILVLAHSTIECHRMSLIFDTFQKDHLLATLL